MSTEKASNGWSRRTLAAQALGNIDTQTRAIVPPVHISTTYLRDSDGGYRSGFVYGRPDNQTVREAESIIAMMEGAPQALVFSSGMSAATSVFLSLSPGDHVVAPHVMYWALRNWLLSEASHWGLIVTFADMSNPDLVRAAVRPGQTQLVWIETPGNPLWCVTDIAEVASIAHDAGAKLAVDSTCATPVLSQPLALGADIVMHAATKYLNGHSDVIAGALACATPDAFWERIARCRKSLGTVLGPWEAFLLIRGMRTVDLRVRAQSASALELARRLQSHPCVSDVLYPGLEGRSDHAVAKKQMSGGFGGMLSIRVQGGERMAIETAGRVNLWKRATSLGGVESLIEHRASIEGPGTPCPPDLLRLSTGIEDVDDLFCDLDRALREVGDS